MIKGQGKRNLPAQSTFYKVLEHDTKRGTMRSVIDAPHFIQLYEKYDHHTYAMEGKLYVFKTLSSTIDYAIMNCWAGRKYAIYTAYVKNASRAQLCLPHPYLRAVNPEHKKVIEFWQMHERGKAYNWNDKIITPVVAPADSFCCDGLQLGPELARFQFETVDLNFRKHYLEQQLETQLSDKKLLTSRFDD